MAFPDGGAARDRDGFGTPALRTWGGDFTSLSGGGNIVSSLGSDNGPSSDGPDVGGPVPTPFDYNELNADYSSSTLGDGLFPATVTDFGRVEPLILNDPILFGDSDHAGGFSVNAFGSGSLVPLNLDPPEDQTRKKSSGQCSSDGSGFICEGSFMPTSPSAGSNAGYPSGNQSPILPGADAPFGGASPSPQQISPFELLVAQKSFALTWSQGAIEGAFPPACCDVASVVVDGATAPASDFANLGGNPNSYQPPDPSGGSPFANGGGQSAPSVVPEIPPPAMLLIGFAALALLGSRRLRGSTRLG